MGSVTIEDIRYMMPSMVSNTGNNGGRIGDVEFKNLSHNELFGYITQDLRRIGAIIYKKLFWLQKNADNSYAYDVMLAPLLPTNAGDRLYYMRGTDTDTQAEITLENTNLPAQVGVGKLYADISAGAASLVVSMENNDFQWEPASKIYIYNGYQTSQTMETDDAGNPRAFVGDSVLWSSTNNRWEKLSARTLNFTYPNGTYIGNNTVLSQKTDTVYDFVRLKENKFTETIGTGNGSTTSPSLSGLTHITNGLVLIRDFQPTLTVTCGGIERTVTVKPDGACSGYCSAGQLNISTGGWITPITWTTSPDNASAINISYYDKNYTYTGNNATLYFDSGSSNTSAYSASNTYVSGIIASPTPIRAKASGIAVSSLAGTYDEENHPVACFNDGTLRHDTITFLFTSSSTFSVSGNIIGDLGSGSISYDFSPINPKYGSPWFSLLKNGFGGTFVAGDTITFTIYPATLSFWIKEVIPENTGPTPNNLIAFMVHFA